MDILDVIKNEHREVADMLDQADACDPGDARLFEIAKKIEHALSTHAKIEERLFYAKLRERAEASEERVDVFEAYTEHDVLAHLMGLLRSGRKPDQLFKAEMQVLGENVKHHVKEEESTVFKIGRELIDPEEREALGEQWGKARKRADANPTSGTKRKKKGPARPGSRKKSGAKKSRAKKSGAKKTTTKKSKARKRR